MQQDNFEIIIDRILRFHERRIDANTKASKFGFKATIRRQGEKDTDFIEENIEQENLACQNLMSTLKRLKGISDNI